MRPELCTILRMIKNKTSDFNNSSSNNHNNNNQQFSMIQLIVYFSITFSSTFSVAMNQSFHYIAWKKKEIKSIDCAENNNNRNNDNKWTGATVRPPRGIGGDLLRETRHRRRSEPGTTCKSEPLSPPVPPAGEIERNVHRTEVETMGERAARERGWSSTESQWEQG